MNRENYLKVIDNVVNNQHVTAYNIAQGTSLTEAGIRKILKKDGRARLSSLKEIHDFLISTYLDTELSDTNTASEPTSPYNKDSVEDAKSRLQAYYMTEQVYQGWKQDLEQLISDHDIKSAKIKRFEEIFNKGK